MKRSVFVMTLCAAGVLAAGAVSVGSRFRGRAFDDEDLLTADAAQLEATEVWPHMDAAVPPGQNVLWCGTFQLAWNEACRVVGEDLRLAGAEQEIVAALNRKSFTEDDLDDASYVALGDFVRNDPHGRIKAALAAKFKGRATPRLVPPVGLTPRPQDIVCYAYLFKHLEFAEPFERLDEPLDFAGERVSCFGVGEGYKPGHAKVLPQILIHDYRDADDFVIELVARSDADRVILAKLKPSATLAETVTQVRRRAAGSAPPTASPGDVLKVPRLNFDVTRQYRELEGRSLTTSNPEVAKDLVLLSALQNIRFQLDELGVRLHSESQITFGCSAPERPPTQHRMVFDKPFLILLERDGAASPYFAFWVDNAELILRAN